MITRWSGRVIRCGCLNKWEALINVGFSSDIFFTEKGLASPKNCLEGSCSKSTTKTHVHHYNLIQSQHLNSKSTSIYLKMKTSRRVWKRFGVKVVLRQMVNLRNFRIWWRRQRWWNFRVWIHRWVQRKWRWWWRRKRRLLSIEISSILCLTSLMVTKWMKIMMIKLLLWSKLGVLEWRKGSIVSVRMWGLICYIWVKPICKNAILRGFTKGNTMVTN